MNMPIRLCVHNLKKVKSLKISFMDVDHVSKVSKGYKQQHKGYHFFKILLL